MTAEELAARLEAKRAGTGWSALCPAHEDRNPSLSISAGTNGNVLVHCHAGCHLDEILAALNLSLADLQSDAPHRNGNGKPEIVATYDYTDEQGTVLFQVVRKVNKVFRQRRPDGRGGWLWGIPDIRRVLYRLPALLQAKAEGRPIYVVEGEKDVGTLEGWGLTATTAPMGADSPWLPDYTAALRGADVRIIPDNDDKGRKHAAKILRALPNATILTLPTGKDVTEWAGLGGTSMALVSLRPADPAPPGPPAPEPDERPEERYTDMGNGRRFARLHGATFRYCHPFGRWYQYSDGYWQEDATTASQHAAKATIEAMHQEALDGGSDQKKLRKWALESEGASRVRAMLELARSEPGIPVKPDAFDRQPHLLNLANGTLDLRTEQLRGHQPGDLLTTKLPFAYRAEATCPRWESFLHRALDGQSDMLEFIRRAVGYSLTGSTGEQCFFFLHGAGANGKSVFLRTLLALFGSAGRTANFSTFLYQRDNRGPRPDLARLAGARLVIAAEAGEGQRFDEELLKSITGGERITARKLYAEEFEFTPQFTLWLAANHRPVIRGNDLAIWRRVCLVPFTVTIPEEERIPLDTLCGQLTEELPGILNWALAGHRDWAERGLSKPAAVIVATEEYRENSDPLKDFLDQHTIVSKFGTCRAADLYTAYKSWCSINGDSCRSQTWFGGQLRDRNFSTIKSGGNKVYVGIVLSNGDSGTVSVVSSS